MVYRFDDPLDPLGSIFCWESTTLSDISDADTGKLTKGIVMRILTKSSSHPHGIKVMLEDGQVGRIKE